MPYELADLIQRRVRTVEINATADGSVRLHVDYSPDAMTPDVWARLQTWANTQGTDEADPFDVASCVLEPMLRAIRVTENGVTEPLSVNGAPFAMDAASLVSLGIQMLGSISRAVQSDFWALRDASDTKKDSAATSLTIVPPVANAPTGS